MGSPQPRGNTHNKLSPEAGLCRGCPGAGAGGHHKALWGQQTWTHLSCIDHLLRQTPNPLVYFPVVRTDDNTLEVLNQKREQREGIPTHPKKMGDFLETLEPGKPPFPVPLLFTCVALGKLLQVSEPVSH